MRPVPVREREARLAEEPAAEAPPEDEFAALVELLRDAEIRFADAEHDLVVLARRQEELHQDEIEVAIGTADPGKHELAAAEIEIECAATRKRRDREKRVVEALRSRCADRAEETQRAAEAEIEERLAGRRAEIEQHQARIAGLHAEQAADEQRLDEARGATRRARVPFDAEAAKVEGALDRQEAERLRAWAKLPAFRLEVERLSPSTLAKVEAERARLKAQAEAAREHDRELAARSWEEAGISGPASLGPA